MGVSQKSHHQTKHGMSADVEVKQSPLKRNAVALERGNPLKRISLFGEGEPLEVNPIRFGEGEPLEANPIRLGEGESLEPNRLLSLYLALVANRSRERSSEKATASRKIAGGVTWTTTILGCESLFARTASTMG